ncbi:MULTISPECIES: hypothetical protein [Aphanothece]|uniref:hypothetical protein n=1 Tax=Aphanothece TaxID=1121 RepID=UPI00398F4FC1
MAAFGWPANLQGEALYPFTKLDSKGETLTGANNDTLSFTKGATPPDAEAARAARSEP